MTQTNTNNQYIQSKLKQTKMIGKSVPFTLVEINFVIIYSFETLF